MTILQQIKQKAANLHKTIVLCEGEDSRVVKAAADATKEGIAKIVLLGNEEEIRLHNPDVDLTGVTIVNHLTSDKLPAYNEKLCQLRASKGMTPEQAAELLKDATYFGAMMLKMGEVDGLVSGACHSTGDTVRPALQIVKMKPGCSRVSGAMVMLKGDERYLFSDIAINITVDAQAMGEIAVESAKTAKTFDIDPKVALLSFSTKGSAVSPESEKVAEATKIAQELAPELPIDGELQFDAAFVASVGERKAPGSKVAGHANTFIFPSLEAGNIGYKIAQRFGGFEAIGPILQGLAKPINDLSRGCDEEDAYKLAIITAAQAVAE